jgi:ABC-type glutathione transport system ATPase component
MRPSVNNVDGKINTVLAKETLADIRCVAARYNADSTPDRCMEGTRLDVISGILARLMNPPDSAQRLVMLSGSAGSGKSTIAKTVASILAEENGVLAASFFFSRDYSERNEIKYVSTTLARQLADYSTDFKRLLVEFLVDDRMGILSAEPRVQFQKLVVDILAKLPASSGSSPWVICVDALDECGTFIFMWNDLWTVEIGLYEILGKLPLLMWTK